MRSWGLLLRALCAVAACAVATADDRLLPGARSHMSHKVSHTKSVGEKWSQSIRGSGVLDRSEQVTKEATDLSEGSDEKLKAAAEAEARALTERKLKAEADAEKELEAEAAARAHMKASVQRVTSAQKEPVPQNPVHFVAMSAPAAAPGGAPGGPGGAPAGPGSAPAAIGHKWAAETHKEEFGNEYVAYTVRKFKAPDAYKDKKWLREMKEGPGRFDLDKDYTRDRMLPSMKEGWAAKSAEEKAAEEASAEAAERGSARTPASATAAILLTMLTALLC